MEHVIKVFGQIGAQEGESPHPEGVFTYTDLAKAVRNAKDGDTFKVVIDSVGGYVDEAFRIASLIEAIGATTVAVRVFSAANILFFAGSERVIEPNATFMLHNSRGGAYGTAEDFAMYAEMLRNEDRRMRDYISAKTGIATNLLEGLMAIDRFIDAPEANELGFTAMAKQMRIAAIYMNNPKNEDMDLSKVRRAFAEAFRQSFFKPQAIDLELKDGNMLFVDSEDGDLVGKPAYVNGDPAPDGTHELADGRMVRTEAGMVAEVMEGEPAPAEGMEYEEEKAQLLARIAELEAMVQEKQAEAEAKMDEYKAQVQATLDGYAQRFEDLTKRAKALHSNGKPTDPAGLFGAKGQNHDPKKQWEEPKKSAAMALMEEINNKNKK